MSAVEDGRLRRVSRSLFWNATLLPLITVLNLTAAILIRRYFVLESGIYDVLLGILNSALAYTALGIPNSLPQFLPGLEQARDRSAVRGFIVRASAVRLSLLALALIAMNLFAAPLADRFRLGQNGVVLVHLLTALIALRAGTDLAVKSLQALFAHLWANLVQLLQALLVAVALVVTFAGGRGMTELVVGLIAVALIVLVTAGALLSRGVGRLSDAGRAKTDDPGSRFSSGVSTQRFWRFSAFMYLFEMSNYFAVPAFASLALAASADIATVALFNVGFQIPIMIVVVVLAGFQGLYRPMFAGLLAQGDLAPVRTAFSEVSKVQAILLAPAGAGLGIMIADYIPLLFGTEFAPAVPIARILCAFLFTESLFNLGNIILSVDHRYAPVLAAQGMRVLAAPAFVWLAARGDLLAATTVFGGGRLAAVLVGYFIARKRYALRFPIRFVARLAVPTMIMAAIVGATRTALSPGWPSAIALTLLGAAVMLLGVRLFGVLGPREVDLLRRARLPGASLIIGWLTPES